MIPVNEPLLAGREEEYVLDAVRSGWISSAGQYLDRFEQAWADYCGRRHGVAVSNGSVALQAAIQALRLGPGDEVILPTFTIVSCVQAVLSVGATPVLVDADPRTWTLDVEQVEAAVTDRTRAIMPVHIYGHPADMAAVTRIAAAHGLAVVEDAAEAHGGEVLVDDQWRRCGSLGAVSTFSFYANKLVTTGEGGMVVTDDDELAERARAIRNLCFQRARRFLHEELGNNYRLTNVQAALGLAQVERIDEIVARKRRMGALYNQALAGIDGLQLPVEEPWARNVYWMYAVVLDEARGLDAAAFADRLRAEGVDTRPFFLGMHEQPVLHELGLFSADQFPVAERIARKGLYLPSGLTLTEEQVGSVATAVRRVLA